MDYLPIIANLFVGIAVAGGMILIDYLLGPSDPTPAKLASYECGIKVRDDDARVGLHVRFFGVALLFLLFDVETVFLYPLALTFRALPLFALAETVLFVAVLALGLAFVWRKGAFAWD